MKSYRIVDTRQVSCSAWSHYVQESIMGSVFHTPYMYDVWLDVPGYQPYAFFAKDEQDNICGLIVGFIQTVSTGLLKNLTKRSIQLQSPLYDDFASLSMLLEQYNQFARSKGVIYSEIRNHFIDPHYNNVLQQQKFIWQGHYNIVKQLPDSCDELWKQIHRKRKDGINKAKRFGFELSDDIGRFSPQKLHALIKVKYDLMGLPVPDKLFFENCLKLDSEKICHPYILFDKGEIKIILLSFLYKSTMHALFIGIDQDPEFINKRPVDYFYYKVMEDCVQRGVKYFDWMGAGKPDTPYGVRDFKLQYGGELEDFGRFEITHRPCLMYLATKGYYLLQKYKRGLRK